MAQKGPSVDHGRVSPAHLLAPTRWRPGCIEIRPNKLPPLSLPSQEPCPDRLVGAASCCNALLPGRLGRCQARNYAARGSLGCAVRGEFGFGRLPAPGAPTPANLGAWLPCMRAGFWTTLAVPLVSCGGGGRGGRRRGPGEQLRAAAGPAPAASRQRGPSACPSQRTEPPPPHRGHAALQAWVLLAAASGIYSRA